MPASIHLFRRDRWYESLDTVTVPGAAGLRLCLAPEIMLRDDARRSRRRRSEPPAPPRRREILHEAMRLFEHGDLDVGGLGTQSGAAFAAAIDDIAGLPPALTARWCGLLREAIDGAVPRGRPDRLTLIYLPGNTFTCFDSVFGAVLGGGTVWLRPSRREPVSAARFAAALLAAGWPADRLGFYPTAPALLPALLAATDEQVIYGGPAMAALAGESTGRTVHGPGRGLAVVSADADQDRAADWLAGLVAADSGRFCRNVCTIACLGDPGPIAKACARVLDEISITPADPRWPIAALADADAAAMADAVTGGLGPGDIRVTGRDPLLRAAGRTWFVPTLVLLRWQGGHPLLQRELPGPFAAVTGVDAGQLAELRERSIFVHQFPGFPGEETA
jgi:Aldehyde dehydrogenase family